MVFLSAALLGQSSLAGAAAVLYQHRIDLSVALDKRPGCLLVHHLGNLQL